MDKTEFCKLIDLAIKDEKEGAEHYRKMSRFTFYTADMTADELEKAATKEMSLRSVLVDAARDEEHHALMLEWLKGMVCGD